MEKGWVSGKNWVARHYFKQYSGAAWRATAWKKQTIFITITLFSVTLFSPTHSPGQFIIAQLQSLGCTVLRSPIVHENMSDHHSGLIASQISFNTSVLFWTCLHKVLSFSPFNPCRINGSSHISTPLKWQPVLLEFEMSLLKNLKSLFFIQLFCSPLKIYYFLLFVFSSWSK